MSLSLEELIERTSELHDHLCPRQILGIRMGILAGEMLDLPLPQNSKRLFAFVETDGCFADGVSVASGCWLGHRTMRLVDYGRVAATFVDTETGTSIRICPHPESRDNAQKALPNEENHWKAQLAAYQILPNEKLLSWQFVELTVSMKAIISQPGVRTICSRCGEEILNEREVLIDDQPVCPACIGEAYYRQPADQFEVLPR